MPKLQEISIDLTTQELLEPLSLTEALGGLTEIEDIGDLDVLHIPVEVANLDQPPAASAAADDSVEIELSAQEIDALLAGMLPRS